MDLLLHNAFRVLALPVTATDREKIARIDEIRTSASIGRMLHFEYDRIWPGPIKRESEYIQAAAEVLQSPARRLEHVLMWFRECDETDRAAMTELENGNLERAEEIWQQPGMLLTDKNVSHLHNLALLYMRMMWQDGKQPRLLEEDCLKTVRIWDMLLSFRFFFGRVESLAGCPNSGLSGSSAARIVYSCLAPLCCNSPSGRPSLALLRILSKSEFLRPFVPASDTQFDQAGKQSLRILNNVLKTVLNGTKTTVCAFYEAFSGFIYVAAVWGAFALLPFVCEMFKGHEEPSGAKNIQVGEASRNITVNTISMDNELEKERLDMEINEKRSTLDDIESRMEVLEAEIEESDNSLRLVEDEIEDEDNYREFEYEQTVMDYEDLADEDSALRDELEYDIEDLENLALDMDY